MFITIPPFLQIATQVKEKIKPVKNLRLIKAANQCKLPLSSASKVRVNRDDIVNFKFYKYAKKV
jgi:hypothetical protein